MRKNTRVVQITGLRGLLIMVFIGVCLAAGFVAFPGYAAMRLWNHFSTDNWVPAINLIQGTLLWAIIAIIVYMANCKDKYLVTMRHSSELSEEELQKLMEKIKIQAPNFITEEEKEMKK
ncbi:MAG: hypothetical protein LBJ74_02425 [Heliobacteriaceae bacterium]|jgi:hypothetical protein|nr:hypothetical protein [Heliobacteriaceae bacterium]